MIGPHRIQIVGGGEFSCGEGERVLNDADRAISVLVAGAAGAEFVESGWSMVITGPAR